MRNHLFVMNKLCLLFIPMLLCQCAPKMRYVDVKDIDSLGVVIYEPCFSRVDLRCGTMPSVEEKDVIFCAEAAFTETLSDTFFHANIDGNHVSGGRWYEGARCVETPDKVGNTGGFVWYDGHFEFFADTLEAEQGLRTAAEKGGMGFCQEIIIHEGKYVSNTRTENPRFNRVEFFRVLAEIDGKLCVVETKEKMLFSAFVEKMLLIPVTEALYMDMGAGWNHSWFRPNDEQVIEIHEKAYKSRFCTNWITFYK